MTTANPPSRLRSRLTLLLIVALFFGSFALAAWLRFSGWQPPGSRNYGRLLQPPRDLSALTFKRADGSDYPWAPERNLWRIVVAPTRDCSRACTQTLDALYRVWLREGRLADRVDVLWFGPLPAGPHFRRLVQMQPDPRLTAVLPTPARADAVPVYFIDPSGFLVLQYPAGFELAGLHKDLDRVLK